MLQHFSVFCYATSNLCQLTKVMFGFNKHQLKNGILLAFILFLFTQLWQELIEEDNLATESSYQELSEKSFKTHGGHK